MVNFRFRQYLITLSTTRAPFRSFFILNIFYRLIVCFVKTYFHPPLGDLLMLRPGLPNLPYLYSTFHPEYPSELSRLFFGTFLPTILILMRCDCCRFLRVYAHIDNSDYSDAPGSHLVFMGLLTSIAALLFVQ